MIEFQKHIHYSQELEIPVLGVCMLENLAFARIFGLVDEQHFYFDSSKAVFSAMKTLYETGRPIDILTVTDELMRVRGITELNGYNTAYVVTTLTNHVVTSAHLEYWCFIIKSMWVQREIIKLTRGGNPKGETIREQITDLQTKLLNIGGGLFKKEWQDMTELMIGVYQHQEKIKVSDGVGVPTGISVIDKQNGGFHPGQMIVLGARPSVGKSAFIGGVAVEMARRGQKVGIISLEMNNNEIAARLAAYDSDINFNTIFRGLYQDEAQSRFLYERIGKHTSQLQIFVSDKTDVNANEIRAKAAKLKAVHGLDCLIIDYLQLVSSNQQKNKNREQEVSEISRACKIMAKEMNIPVIVLCQLNREVTKRKGADRYPHLSDLRESGSIEQDSDVVMFLHRDWLSGITEDEHGNSTEHSADLIVRKWRNGNSNFIIPLLFDGPKMKFSENKQQPGYVPAHYQDDNPF